MHPLTERDVRASFVNASRREAAQATLPDLSALRWDRLDYLGWTDRKAPLMSYVVVPDSDGTDGADGVLVGVVLRSTDRTARRRQAVCAWCEDVVAVDDVSLYVARRAGASGRSGNTIGTLICTRFACSANVRRPPRIVEAGDDPEGFVAGRIDGLRERAARFVAEVRRTA
jgi:hypothetical protein